MNAGCAGKTVRSLENACQTCSPYMCVHDEALYKSTFTFTFTFTGSYSTRPTMTVIRFDLSDPIPSEVCLWRRSLFYQTACDVHIGLVLEVWSGLVCYRLKSINTGCVSKLVGSLPTIYWSPFGLKWSESDQTRDRLTRIVLNRKRTQLGCLIKSTWPFRPDSILERDRGRAHLQNLQFFAWRSINCTIQT